MMPFGKNISPSPIFHCIECIAILYSIDNIGYCVERSIYTKMSYNVPFIVSYAYYLKVGQWEYGLVSF
jgi:hypothetical protein